MSVPGVRSRGGHALSLFSPCLPFPCPHFLHAAETKGLLPEDVLPHTTHVHTSRTLQVTEGLLPADVLPHRVQRLCEEVGVEFKPEGGAAEMLRALKQVQAEVGIPG